MIETRRLKLIAATLDSLRAELENAAVLASVLGVAVPENWPPEFYDRGPVEFTIRRLRETPQEAGWWLYYFVQKPTAEAGETAIGCGGYKGPPSADGTVEIGYSVLAQYRRRRYATEAAEGLVRHAFAQPEVERVIAETLPELLPSIGVLEKCGFRLTGEGSQPGVIRYDIIRGEWEARSSVAARS